MDYLDPQAVKKFLALTYDRFDKRFREHFGTTIHMTFFDDLSTMHAPDCLMWTPSFREQIPGAFRPFGRALLPGLVGRHRPGHGRGPRRAVQRAQ